MKKKSIITLCFVVVCAILLNYVAFIGFNIAGFSYGGMFGETGIKKGIDLAGEAVSLETVDHKAKSTINISNCLDIEKGTVTVSVENVGQDDQTINIDIDGEVYTKKMCLRLYI